MLTVSHATLYGQNLSMAPKISGFDATDMLGFSIFDGNAKLTFVENAAKTSGTLTIKEGSYVQTITRFGQVVAGFHLGNQTTYTDTGGFGGLSSPIKGQRRMRLSPVGVDDRRGAMPLAIWADRANHSYRAECCKAA
jgi:hypothetical protein